MGLLLMARALLAVGPTVDTPRERPVFWAAAGVRVALMDKTREPPANGLIGRRGDETGSELGYKKLEPGRTDRKGLEPA